MAPLTSFQQPDRSDVAPAVDPRMPTASLFCAGALLLGVAMALAQTGVAAGDPERLHERNARDRVATGALEGMPRTADRLREGTELVDQPGTFRTTGDRITFFTDLGGGRFVVLENLALERVGRAIEDNPRPLDWLVTGTMTEYRGENLLLLHRAVLRSQGG